MANIHIANTKPNKDNAAVPVSDKADFVVMDTIRDEEGNFIIIKWSIYQEYKFLCVFAPTNKGTIYLKQKLIAIKENIDKSTIMVRGFNTHL